MILAIDPGSTKSGYALVRPSPVDGQPAKLKEFGHVENRELFTSVEGLTDETEVVIESIAVIWPPKGGAPISGGIIDTIRWEGWFRAEAEAGGRQVVALAARSEAAVAICGKRGPSDAEVRAALVARFGDTEVKRTHCKGGAHCRDAWALATWWESLGFAQWRGAEERLGAA